MKTAIRCVMMGILFLGISAAQAENALNVWPVDPLIKVFQDTTAGRRTIARAEVARGEVASFQICVRTGKSIILSARMTNLKRMWGSETLTPRTPRFVGYVPVDRPTPKPSKDQLRKPPADYPDPLLETGTVDVTPNKTQPIWITVTIPENAVPGTYHGTLTITGLLDGKEIHTTQKLSIRVYKAVAGKSRLWVTEWFSPSALHMKIKPQADSEEFYALLGRYAQNMAEHRHNVALISPLNLADYSVGEDGQLKIDFARFDRWVHVFKEKGVIGRIEGGHIGGRVEGWESAFVVTVRQIKDGKVVSSRVNPTSQEADAFYKRFFPALVSHLREQGWLDIYRQHLADEPIAKNIKSYRAMAALARKYAPELKTIEACHTKDLVGAIDIWVPQLNYLHDDFPHYQGRQKAGEEVWFYTCMYPQGNYANRFLEQPLIETRILHWINFNYGITGYLHWGYNQWTTDDPFKKTTRNHDGSQYLPAGDAWIVYPGDNGPLDSIRFEAMRDGIADYELLCKLAEKDPVTAKRLAAKCILDFDQYNIDVNSFRETRRTLLKMLSRTK